MPSTMSQCKAYSALTATRTLKNCVALSSLYCRLNIVEVDIVKEQRACQSSVASLRGLYKYGRV